MGGVLAMAARTCRLHLRALVPRHELHSARLGGRRSAGMRVKRVGLLMRAVAYVADMAVVHSRECGLEEASSRCSYLYL
jgi:hypothetical protein